MLYFRSQGLIPLKQCRRSNSDHSSWRLCCFYIWDLRFSFWTNLLLHWLHLILHCVMQRRKRCIAMKQSMRSNFGFSSQRFCCFYLCVPRISGCNFRTILILHCLHLKIHLIIQGEIPSNQSGRSNFGHSSNLKYKTRLYINVRCDLT